MNNTNRRPPERTQQGPGPGPRMAFEKPKDAAKVTRRLAGYLRFHTLTLALVLLLVLISTGTNLAASYMLKPLINNYILPGDFAGLARGLALLAAIYIVGAGASYGQSRLMVNVAQRTSNRLRRELFAKMQTLPVAYFDARTHGELMSRYTNDIDNVQLAFEQSLIQLVTSAVSLAGAAVMMLILSPLLFVITAAVAGLMFFVMDKLGDRSRNYFRSQQRNIGAVNGYVEELVEGLKVVKVFGHEAQAIAEFRARNETLRKAATNASFFAGIAFPITGNLNNIGYALTALAGGVLTVLGRFDIGSLAAYLQYARQVGFPVQQITMQFNTVQAALAGAERVFEMMDQPAEVDAGRVELVSVGPEAWAWHCADDAATVATPLRGDVRFHNVTFGYVPAKPVLHDVSLYAKPGQKIAFVGSTGAGKTTITNLINRFYEVQDGAITFDGIDIKDIKKDSLRASIGMVLQDTHLFSGSVMDNIRFGRLAATDADCVAAAKQANAHSFIKRLPQGYQTPITADGANLSQGQRQLLAIARAAVADPPVLILDEATSSIDTRTERLIEQGLDALMHPAGGPPRTVFVIAHRLSTVRNANAIIVIEDGKIIERGDHADLLGQRGRYWELYTGQFELA